MNPGVAEILARKYWLALAVVAVLILGDAALIQPSMTRLATDAPLINTAGRQRMLGQRLAKAALAFERGDDQARGYLAEMSQVLDLWSTSHEQLLREAKGAGAEARDGMNQLEPSFKKIQTAARRVVQAGAAGRPDPTALKEGLAGILDNEAEYLERMDHVVELHERDARGRVESLRRLSWAVAGATLITLAAIGLFILRPAVTLIRRQVAELGQARDDLEDRVRERTWELEQAKDRHRALVEQFSHVGRTSAIGEMASGLAHELRQPLGAIANYTEGCLVELSSPEPAVTEIRGVLERILATTGRASRIIERIRNFVTRQELRHEPFEPNRLVEEVEEILGAEARQREVAVRLDLAPDLPILHGDPVQVQQVLVNLVHNAFEAIAAAKPLEPAVLIETIRTRSGGARFRVTDNGEGIDPERIERVFDAYFSTRAGGMGMGLAISRTIIEAHQGEISVTSSPEVATTFQFTLPAGDGDDDAPHGLHRG